MSEVKVNKISPRSGTGVQLGDSGDTITIPAGATIANNGTATGFDTDTNDKVKVSTNDTTAGFLNGKLVAGTNVTLTEGNDGGNETLTVAAAGSNNTPNFRAYRSSAQSFSASTNSDVQFNATSFDSASAFNTSNGKFTVPNGQGGKYSFTTSLRLNNSGVNSEVAVYFFVGSSEKSFSNKTVGGDYPTVMHSDILSLSAGNEVIVKIYTALSSPILDGGGAALYTTFEGFKLAE